LNNETAEKHGAGNLWSWQRNEETEERNL